MSTQLRFSDSFADKLEEALKKLLQEEGAQLTCTVWGVPEGSRIGLDFSLTSSHGETLMPLGTVSGLQDRHTVSLGNLGNILKFRGK
jgi:hypothetical protein